MHAQKIYIETRSQAFVGAAASAATVAAESAAPSGELEVTSFNEVRSEKKATKATKATKQTDTCSCGASTTFRKNVLQPLINLLAGKMREKGPWHRTGCGRTHRNFLVDYSLTDKTRGCCSEVRLCSGMVARTCKWVANRRTWLHWVKQKIHTQWLTRMLTRFMLVNASKTKAHYATRQGFQKNIKIKHWFGVSPVAWSCCPNKRKISASFANWTLGGTSTPRKESAIHFSSGICHN